MHYELIVLNQSGTVSSIYRNIVTREQLAKWIDHALIAWPREKGYTYEVTGVVTKRFTLLDANVTTGDETAAKLWGFMQGVVG